MKIRTTLLSYWVLMSLALVVWAGDKPDASEATESNYWPQFRGPAGNGHTEGPVPGQWSETENVVWKTAIHGRGWSSPVIWGNQIWLTTATADGKQMFGVCVDRESGKILFDEKLFDVAEPREIHKTNSYASPTPVIEEGRVYLNFGSYGTTCLDTKTFERIWTRRDLPCHHWRGPGSSPILDGNKLIMHFDGYDYQYVAALDKRTGDTIWRVDRDIDYQTDNGDFKKAFCTPIVIEVNGQRQLISPAAKATIAYDPESGKELWRIHYKEHSATARPLYGHGLLFINSGFGKAELFGVRPDGKGDVTDTHVKWVANRRIGSKPSGVLVGDFIFQVHDQGVASCIEAKTGKQVKEQRLSGNYSASPIYADGKLFFANEDGETRICSADREMKILQVNHLDAGCMASPAAVDGRLYLRTRTHLYCIGED